MPVRDIRVSSLRRGRRSLERQLDDIRDSLAIIEQLCKQTYKAMKQSKRREISMARTLDEAIAAMERNTTVEEGLYTLIESLKAQSHNLGLKPEDQAKVDKLFDQAEAQSARAAAALTANTPAEQPTGASTGHMPD